MRRYLFALLVAGVVIAAIAAFSWWGYTLPRLAVGHADVNMSMPDHVLTLMALARFLAITWYVWAPAVVLVSLGVAALTGRGRGRAASARRQAL